MNRFSHCILILAVITASLAMPADAEDAEELMERAMEEYRADRTDQTFFLLKQALELDPSHEGVLYRLCLLNVVKERFGEAEPFCRTLVKKYPGNDSYRFNLFWSRANENIGIVQNCAGRSDFDCAIRVAKRIVETDPDIPQAHYLLGNMHVMRGGGREDHLRTVAHLREAIRLHEALGAGSELALSPQDLAAVYTGLGVTFGREDDHDRSVESFEKALELEPNVIDGQRNLEIARRRRAEGSKSGVVWLSLADILGIR